MSQIEEKYINAKEEIQNLREELLNLRPKKKHDPSRISRER
jgi:ribosomal protein L29